MLGISYGELFLILGATAALIGARLLYSLWFVLFCDRNGDLRFLMVVLLLLTVLRAEGSSDYSQDRRQVGRSCHRICPASSWPVRQRYAADASSSGSYSLLRIDFVLRKVM